MAAGGIGFELPHESVLPNGQKLDELPNRTCGSVARPVAFRECQRPAI